MEIIVLKVTAYKEKDGIIDAISEDGEMSFLVRGLFDPKSKNAFINNPLTIVDVDFSEGKYKYPVVKSSMMIESPINPRSDLRYMGSLMMINEVTNFLLSEDEKPVIYAQLRQTILDLKHGAEPLKILVGYLAKVLKISGYDFDVQGCVFCGGRKNIVTFSFTDGGFICGDCYTPDMPKLFNKNQMLAIREAFLTDKSYISQESSDEELLFVLAQFAEFIHDSYGYKLKSLDLIK